jgi:hypothetical protein
VVIIDYRAERSAMFVGAQTKRSEHADLRFVCVRLDDRLPFRAI